MRPERPGIHRDVDRFEPKLGQRLADDRLAGLLAAERGVLLDEPGEQLGHPVAALRDGVGDLVVLGSHLAGRRRLGNGDRQAGVGMLGGSDPAGELAAGVRGGPDAVPDLGGDRIQGG